MNLIYRRFFWREGEGCRAPSKIIDQRRSGLALREFSLLANKTHAQRAEGGWKGAIIHRNRNVNVLFGVLEDFHFNLVLLTLEFDLVGLYLWQIGNELLAGFCAPPLDLGIQNGLPLLSTSHISNLRKGPEASRKV